MSHKLDSLPPDLRKAADELIAHKFPDPEVINSRWHSGNVTVTFTAETGSISTFIANDFSMNYALYKTFGSHRSDGFSLGGVY